jgi:ergothioneine biosynthesis protein EgtB
MTDLKHTFSLNPLFPIYKEGGSRVNDWNTEEGWMTIEEGVHSVGYAGEGFCFDNELGRHRVYLQSARLRKHLVTNAEYIEFIEQGGYANFEHWLDEGWAWVKENKAESPLYWYKEKDTWYHFTLGGYMPVDSEAILCHVNYYEAEAFARWKGMRLPTEFEWEVAAPALDWGKRWEWTGSAYLPYPGFSTAAGALGEYNGKFMVNQMVLRGASVATAPEHSRISYRNFFHPQYRWQFSGIRLATHVI